MNIKRKMKLYILQGFSWVPDRSMLKFQYRMKTKRKLNLENPQRYTEKLQWYKLYYRDPLMAKCADKYTVREYIKIMECEEILIPLLGVYEKFEDIDFTRLKNPFVLKSTNGGGGNKIFLYGNEGRIDNMEIARLRKSTKDWLKPCKVDAGREWVYCVEKPRLIIETMLKTEEEYGLCDYKFFCFYGKIEIIYYIYDRCLGKKAKLIICDENLHPLPYYRKDEVRGKITPKQPKNFEEMKKIASKLSGRFPHARIDLYNINGKIYFGEITFFDGSGYMSYEPDEFDRILGDKFLLPKRGGGR